MTQSIELWSLGTEFMHPSSASHFFPHQIHNRECITAREWLALRNAKAQLISVTLQKGAKALRNKITAFRFKVYIRVYIEKVHKVFLPIFVLFISVYSSFIVKCGRMCLVILPNTPKRL